jgi:hypothetical protein
MIVIAFLSVSVRMGVSSRFDLFLFNQLYLIFFSVDQEFILCTLTPTS